METAASFEARFAPSSYPTGSGDDILAETDASGNTTAEYIFFGGKRIAMLRAGSSPVYYVEDMLGTSRVLATNTGAVCYDADFYPYGGERAYTNTCPQNYKFESKERDTETGNDDFGARYYSNRFGRWLSADWSAVPTPVPHANLTNPQTLKLYAMVADDPESFADLDGHDELSYWLGKANAFVSDNLFGIGRMQRSDPDFNRGQKDGDEAALAESVVELAAGTVLEEGGGGLVLTGVGAPEGALAAGGGVVLQVHGVTTGTIAAVHLLESRRVGDFTTSEKKQMDQKNANQNEGQNKCTECGQDVQKVQNKKGETPPGNQLQRYHDPPLSKSGNSKSPKNRIVCRDCHLKIHKPKPPKGVRGTPAPAGYETYSKSGAPS